MHTLPATLSSNTYSPVSIWRGILINIDSDPNLMSEINVFGEKKPRIPSGPARKTITIPPAPLISPRTPPRPPRKTTYCPTTDSPDLPLIPYDRPLHVQHKSRGGVSWGGGRGRGRRTRKKKEKEKEPAISSFRRRATPSRPWRWRHGQRSSASRRTIDQNYNLV